MEELNELNAILDKLTNAIKLMAKYGTEHAEKEREYKIILNQVAMKLRNEGLAVTLIDKTVYGEKEVADKRFERDVAKVMYDTSKENINVLKIKARILDNQINKEYNN